VTAALTTKKQGENAEYMFESRTTQMEERENDEDITNMDTPTVVAYDSMVNYSLASVYLIHVTNGRCTMICVKCHLQSTYMDQRRRGSCMERMDYETPGLGTEYNCSLRFHQV
jgi:hypothetical protein